MTNFEKYILHGDNLKALGDLSIYYNDNYTTIAVDENTDKVVFRAFTLDKPCSDLICDFVNFLKEDADEEDDDD